MNRRRKDKQIQSAQTAKAPVPSIAHFVQDLDSIREFPGALPVLCSDPARGQTRCPRCDHEYSVRSRTEYTPISKAFEPFYRRALNGDLQALVEYFNESWGRADLGAAFYQCLGYLVAKGFPKHVKIVEAILNIHATGGTFRKAPAKRAIYKYWNKVFTHRPTRDFDDSGKPILGPSKAEEIRDWLRTTRIRLQEFGEAATRHDLWDAYVAEKLPALDARTSPSQYHKGLRELFWAIAQTQPRISPSQAARKVACRIAEISESTISHPRPLGKS